MAALCLQSAVLGFGVFRVLERYGITSGLSIGENVILPDYLSCHSNNALGSRQAHSCAQLPLGKITHVRSSSSWPTAHIIKIASFEEC